MAVPSPSEKQIDFYQLDGGLNTVSSSIALKKNEARDLQNIDFFPLYGISMRNGLFMENTLPLSSHASTGMYQARFSSGGGTNRTLLVNDTKMYNITTFPASDITNGVTITTGPNNIWNFDILNDIVVASNNVDTILQVSSGLTVTTLTGIQLTTCLFPLEFRGYMCYFNCLVSGTQQYDRFYFSAINDPTTVGSSSFMDIALKSGGDIRGAVDFMGYLYVFKRDKICQVIYQVNRVNSSGAVFPFVEFPNTIVDGIGTMSHRSIAKFTTPATHATPGQQFVFFIDQFGIPRLFDGTTTMSFYSKIGYSRSTLITSLSNMDQSRDAYAFSINYPQKNRVIFWLSQANNQQDTPWVLDYSTGFSISRYKYPYPMNCGTLLQLSTSNWIPWTADYTGNVYQLDTGSNDNGQPIDAYYITPDIYVGSPGIQSQWRYLKIRGQSNSATNPVTVSYYSDGSDNPVITDTRSLGKVQTTWGTGGVGGTMTWAVSTWAVQGVTSFDSEINTQANTMRIKIEQQTLNTTMIVEGMTVGVEPMGQQQN